MKYTKHEAIFEKTTRYVPVADAIFGYSPIVIRTGLKIAHPPSPKAPATHPPQNPSASN
jgi:hypothetical protein